MIKTLLKTLEIDLTYSINSFIYNLSKLPIFKDLITNDIYQSKIIKNIVKIIVILKNIIKSLFFKFIYYYIIYIISTEEFTSNNTNIFLHIFFFSNIIGMFINNKMINPTKRKYISIVLFNMDGNSFFKSELILNLIKETILNLVMITFITISLKLNIIYIPILLILTISARIIGESINIIFYRKKDYLWYTNTKLYLSVISISFILMILPFANICISNNILIVLITILSILGIYLLTYLFRIKDYKLIYKNICIKSKVISTDNIKDYMHQSKVAVKEKDKEIDTSILEKKKGYDLFNTIFFARHKEILLRSAKKYALIIGTIYTIIALYLLYNPSFNKQISTILEYKLSIFVIVMYFINRGAIITQAMFFNCDHAMLTYNFYREPKVILELFKKRLKTLIRINLIPTTVLAIGNIILILITNNNYSYLSLITTFLFIILLSIFFSIHYLVIYYLLQPYNKNMQMKKFSYSFITMLTYIISYSLKDLILNSFVLSIYGIILILIYIVIALILVYKISPKTFKIN